MSFVHRHTLSRRGFCICCAAAAGFVIEGHWLSPRQAYAKARNIVDLIRDDAAKTPIKVHRLRGNVSILEGSGGNIAVLTGVDGKVFIDAGITASRRRIIEAVNGLSADPITYLVNTHWHFDHTDGNAWLNAEGAAIVAMRTRTSISWQPRESKTGISTLLLRHWRPSRPKSSPWRRPSN